MGDKLHTVVTPPPKKGRATSPKPTSPLKQAQPSPRNNTLSPRFGPLSDTLTVPAISSERGHKPLSKARSFIFSKSFDDTKQFKTRDAAIWSPSQSFDPPQSPTSPLANRQPAEEQPESVEELQVKLRKNNLWRDQYLDLKRLHEMIGKIKRDYLHAEQEFSSALAGQVTRVEMFFRRLVGELLQTDRVFQIQYEPEELEKFIQNIEDYAMLNTEILKNVIYFHDTNSMLKLKPSYAWTIRRDDFCQPALLFPLFVRLSAAYHPLPRAPSMPISPALKRLQTQPDSSNRGIKVSMWIPPNQVVAFVLQVLKYLPLYDPEQFAVPHTTVYFDDSEFRAYQSCVNSASPEAALTCFRWTKDTTKDTQPQVHIDQKLIEGGKHTTKNIGTLPHSLIGKYLKGGHESEEELATALETYPGLVPLQKILTTLRPTLKVEHFRTWFGNHHLKIRLCTQLALLRELDRSQLHKLREWTTPSERIQEQRIHRFPFALVTVRSESLVLPDWLSITVDKYSRQDRFSTYPHGIAMLYESISTQHGRPSWLSGPLAHLFVKSSSDDEKPKDQTAAGYFKHTRSDIQMRTELHRARAHSVSEYMRTGSVDYSSPTSAEHRGSDLSTYRSKQPTFRIGDQSMLPPITRTDALVQNSPDSKDEKREQEPELQTLLPRRLEPAHKPPAAAAAAKSPPPVQLGKRAAEHKTYFANERTFMQWFNAAVLLSTVGLALLSSAHYFLRVIAYLFPLIAILVLCYAYRMYRIRIYTLDHQVPTSKFADMQGPCCLTGLVSCLFLAILILMAIHDTAAPPFLVHAPPDVGIIFGNAATIAPNCNPGFTFPTQMKGIAYNSSSGVLWGVSDSQVYQLYTDSGFTYRFFPQDTVLHVGLIGICVADQPGLVYVGKHAGQILSIDTATKQVVDVWHVEANMSAFTFVGSQPNSSGYFYVAHTMTDIVKVYSLPTAKVGGLQLQKTFIPIPLAHLISAFAFLPASSEMLVNSYPNAQVLYQIKDGVPGQLEKVLPGFDVKEVVSTTAFSDSQVLVLSGNVSVLRYTRDPTTKAYAECLITR